MPREVSCGSPAGPEVPSLGLTEGLSPALGPYPMVYPRVAWADPKATMGNSSGYRRPAEQAPRTQLQSAWARCAWVGCACRLLVDRWWPRTTPKCSVCTTQLLYFALSNSEFRNQIDSKLQAGFFSVVFFHALFLVFFSFAGTRVALAGAHHLRQNDYRRVFCFSN